MKENWFQVFSLENWSRMYCVQFHSPFSNCGLKSLIFVIVRYYNRFTNCPNSQTQLTQICLRQVQEMEKKIHYHFFHLFSTLYGVNILLKCACFTSRCRCKFEHYLQRQPSSSCQFLLCHTKCNQWLWSYHLTVGSRYIAAYTT